MAPIWEGPISLAGGTIMQRLCPFPGVWRLLGLGLVGLALLSSRAVADPGDLAARQDKHLAIRMAARLLKEAQAAVAKSKPGIFNGHREKALAEFTVALEQLDEGIRFAAKNGGTGEKGKTLFQPKCGKVAASQDKFPHFKEGAERARKAVRDHLDGGLHVFGGHRIKAIEAVHRALDQLDLACEFARK
jgi:hypothetical protein